MTQKVDGLAIQFHFAQRNRSAIELVEAMAIVCTLEIQSPNASRLVRSTYTKLLDELRADQTLLAMLRAWMLTGYAEKLFEVPDDVDFLTSRFIPRSL